MCERALMCLVGTRLEVKLHPTYVRRTGVPIDIFSGFVFVSVLAGYAPCQLLPAIDRVPVRVHALLDDTQKRITLSPVVIYIS